MEDEKTIAVLIVVLILFSTIGGVALFTKTILCNNQSFVERQQQYIEYLKQQNYTSTSKRKKIERLEKMYNNH